MGANDKMAATFHGHTPEVRDLRIAYVAMRDSELPLSEARAEFERAIAAIKAQALTDLADQVHSKFQAAWIRGKAREYTHGPHKPVGAFAISENNQEADCGDQGL